MIDCLVIGDSIAVGVHQQRMECLSYSKGGWNTWQWNRDYLKNDLSAKTVIISLGSNDHKNIRTKAELQRIREKIGVKSKVYWILPAGNLKGSEVLIETIQKHVQDISTEYGDIVLPIKKLSKDGIHPSLSGYKELADATR